MNAFWENQSLHNYADYALTGPFRFGLEQLRALGHQERCAIMCAEAVWWRCHRRIIANYLIAAGEIVFHILDESHIEPARLTPAAKPRPDGSLFSDINGVNARRFDIARLNPTYANSLATAFIELAEMRHRLLNDATTTPHAAHQTPTA